MSTVAIPALTGLADRLQCLRNFARFRPVCAAAATRVRRRRAHRPRSHERGASARSGSERAVRERKQSRDTGAQHFELAYGEIELGQA